MHVYMVVLLTCFTLIAIKHISGLRFVNAASSGWHVRFEGAAVTCNRVWRPFADDWQGGGRTSFVVRPYSEITGIIVRRRTNSRASASYSISARMMARVYWRLSSRATHSHTRPC